MVVISKFLGKITGLKHHFLLHADMFGMAVLVIAAPFRSIFPLTLMAKPSLPATKPL
ncbi:hypothetical protein CFter6_1306 [Collimonas fungivorans]|uniref:Uncharacterized protein n=1 Tax=Collimonas fungivorans TaxID=158899 RepID=A0A127P8D5_9BURK|nr:hypothetical protein CFter6_1306 [Collimonas fungivorans]